MIAFADSPCFERNLPLENPPEPKKSRTEAQIQASRVNGSKSRGPRTARGKARSSANAMRHGILARKVVPLSGPLHEDAEYRRLLHGLRADFAPQSTLEAAWVELLASDLVQLGRLKQLQEAVMTPEQMRDNHGGANEYVLDVQDRVKCFEGILGCIGDGHNLRCNSDEALWVSQAIREEIESLTETGLEVRETLEAGETPDEADTIIAQRLVTIDPGRLIPDNAYCQTVLTGKAQIPTEHAQRWLLLLEPLKIEQSEALKRTLGGQRSFDRRYRAHQATLLQRLPSMEVLQRYENQLRKSIERTGRLLQEACRLRGQ